MRRFTDVFITSLKSQTFRHTESSRARMQRYNIPAFARSYPAKALPKLCTKLQIIDGFRRFSLRLLLDCEEKIGFGSACHGSVMRHRMVFAFNAPQRSHCEPENQTGECKPLRELLAASQSGILPRHTLPWPAPFLCTTSDGVF